MKRLLLCLALSLVFAGCSFPTTTRNFNGLTSPEGAQAVHVNTTNIAINLLGSPVAGDASLEKTFSDCTLRAKQEGATTFRTCQSNVSTFWWIFPPISFVIHPVITNVAGDGTIK